MNWFHKKFEELTLRELYSILRLRAEVFVVEQATAYQDVDNKDPLAEHIFAIADEEVVAYTRIFKKGDYFELASIGRVVVKPTYRGINLGHELMERAVSYMDKHNYGSIHISAQTYLQHFYEGYGFKIVSELYLEDGLPHYGMERH
jgi:ElaA protein